SGRRTGPATPRPRAAPRTPSRTCPARRAGDRSRNRTPRARRDGAATRDRGPGATPRPPRSSSEMTPARVRELDLVPFPHEPEPLARRRFAVPRHLDAVPRGGGPDVGVAGRLCRGAQLVVCAAGQREPFRLVLAEDPHQRGGA